MVVLKGEGPVGAMIFSACILLTLGVYSVLCTHSSTWSGGYVSDDFPERVAEYVYYTQKVTWNEARSVCQSIGGDLAKVNSQRTLDMLLHLSTETYSTVVLKDDFWIGLSEYVQGQFTWAIDCSSLDFTSNFLDTWEDNHHCFILRKGSGYNGDRKDCRNNFPFLCERHPARLCHFFPFILERMFSRLSDVMDISRCEYWCAVDSTCEATIFFAPSDCYKIARKTVTSGTQITAFAMSMAAKFCMEFTLNTTAVYPPDNDNIIPDLTCGIQLDPMDTVSSSISPSSTQTPSICSTLLLLDTDSPSPCICLTPTQILTETLLTTVELTPHCTVLSTTEVITTSAVVSQSPCQTSLLPSSSLTPEDAIKLAQKISQNLTVNAKSTSSYIRKLSSARDPRKTSIAMGAVGVVSIVIPLVIIISADMKRFLIFIGWNE